MRPFADDGGNGRGRPWLSGPLPITAAVVLLLIATLIVWRVYRRIRHSHVWDQGDPAAGATARAGTRHRPFAS